MLKADTPCTLNAQQMKTLFLSGYTLSGCAAAGMLAMFSFGHANAAQASAEDRMQMAVAIATDIHDSGNTNAFRTKVVELGVAAIERPWAIAEWRSVDQTVHGQVLFKYFCDHWNVNDVSTGSLAQMRLLTAQGVSTATAAKLVADLTKLRGQPVAYLKANRAGTNC